MADQIGGNVNRTDKGTLSMPDNSSSTAKGLGDPAKSVGRELKDKASDIADTSSGAIKDHAADFVDSAKNVASQATDKVKETIEDKKGAGADYVNGLADAMKRAAGEFDKDVPFAATYIRKAAEQVKGVSDSIRSGNLNDIVSNAQSFARRQPTAFFGIAALAGFGLVRFLKSSAESSSASNRPNSTPGRNNFRPGSFRSGVQNRGYRDDYST